MFNLRAGKHACMRFPRLWRGIEGEAFTRYYLGVAYYTKIPLRAALSR